MGAVRHRPTAEPEEPRGAVCDGRRPQSRRFAAVVSVASLKSRAAVGCLGEGRLPSGLARRVDIGRRLSGQAAAAPARVVSALGRCTRPGAVVDRRGARRAAVERRTRVDVASPRSLAGGRDLSRIMGARIAYQVIGTGRQCACSLRSWPRMIKRMRRTHHESPARNLSPAMPPGRRVRPAPAGARGSHGGRRRAAGAAQRRGRADRDTRR